MQIKNSKLNYVISFKVREEITNPRRKGKRVRENQENEDAN